MTEKIPVLIGLHITKCAGTSLITTLRKTLSENEYCFESSFFENFIATRPLFSEIRSLADLLIYFGHYMNEFHLGVFPDRPLVLFTGVRDPVSRAVSAFRQGNAVRAAAGGQLQPVEAFLAEIENRMCGEILRAFPSLARRFDDRVDAALAGLSLMDFIYATETFDVDASYMLRNLGIASPILSDNISSDRAETARERELAEQCRNLLTVEPERWLGDDIRIYRAIKPYLSRPNLIKAVCHEPWAIDREAFLEDLPPPEFCLSRLAELEADYLAFEFKILGKVGELRHAYSSEISSRKAILEKVATYDPPRSV